MHYANYILFNLKGSKSKVTKFGLSEVIIDFICNAKQLKTLFYNLRNARNSCDFVQLKSKEIHTVSTITRDLLQASRNRGSYMSAHVLLNFLNEWGCLVLYFFTTSLINSIIQEHEC